MAENDTLTLIIEELGIALLPLAGAFASPEEFRLYVEDLGWSINVIPGVLQSLGTALQTLSGRLAQGAIDAAAAPEVLNLIQIVAKAINDIGSAAAAALPPGFTNEFPRQVLDKTVVDYLINNYPSPAAFLRLAGVIEIEPVAAAPGRLAYTSKVVNWAALVGLLSDPLATVEAAYSWSAGFERDRFLRNLRFLADCLGFCVQMELLSTTISQNLFGAGSEGTGGLAIGLLGDRNSIGGMRLGVLVAPTPNAGGLTVVPYTSGDVSGRLPLNEELALLVDSKVTLEGGFAAKAEPGQSISFVDPSQTGASIDTGATIGLERTAADAARMLLGTSGGSRLEYRSLSVRAGARFINGEEPELIFEAGIKGGKIIIDLSGGDGFLKFILPPEPITVETDLSVGFSTSSGLYFGSSSALEILLPVHVALGPVEIQTVLIALRLNDDGPALDLATTVSADLVVIKAIVENMGLRIKFKPADDWQGNAGPLNLAFEFLPPNGVGLYIDAGVVKGGGYLFFDFAKGEYAGACELTISGFLSLKAIGLISTKPEFSMLLIITAEFEPGFQLGYGFVLGGVGGLLGLNRAMKLDPLANLIRTGAVNSILFPQDVITNAPKIISDLKQIFPSESGKFLIGPMAKIGWGTPTLISLSLGVIIEIPGNVVLLGRLRLNLPTEDQAILLLQVSFVGALEFDKRRAWFFATLFESSIIFIPLEGEMGVLLDVSDNPNFVLSVGGFHPAFRPPPLPFPAPARLAVSLIDESMAKVRAELYLAVTTNTAQLGCRLEAHFGFDACSVDGHFGIDVILRFSPVYLVADLSAGFGVKVFGFGLYSVHLRGKIEGPTPWHITGSAKIEVTLLEFDVDVDVEFGERRSDTLPPISILATLKEEFGKIDNWRSTLPASGRQFVGIRKLEAAGSLVVHPVGTLEVSQRLLPLNLGVDKVGNQTLADVKRVALTELTGNLLAKTATRERFAAAQFKKMSDAEKLSAPAFQLFESGIELAPDTKLWKTGRATQRNVRYESVVVDSNRKRIEIEFFEFWPSLFVHFRAGAAISRSPVSRAVEKRLRPFNDKVSLREEGYAVVHAADNNVLWEGARFSSYLEAEQYLREAVRQDFTLLDEIHVVPESEVNHVPTPGEA